MPDHLLGGLGTRLGIFGPIPWLASTHLEYFWPIRSPLDHVLTKPRVSLVREDIRDDSQTFFYGSCICHRTVSQSWTIHNPRKNAHTLRLLPIQLRVRGSCVVFVRHVTKQPSDWPELFVMARTKESAQRYQTRGGRTSPGIAQYQHLNNCIPDISIASPYVG